MRSLTMQNLSFHSKISGPKGSIKITDHFTCTSANVIYCITCTYCNKLYIGETGRRLGDQFREHLRDVGRDDKDASKPVARLSLIILINKWQFASFLYIQAVWRAAKRQNKNLSSKSALSPRYQRARFVPLIYSVFSSSYSHQQRSPIFCIQTHTQLTTPLIALTKG